MASVKSDPFKARKSLATALGDRTIYQIDACRGVGEVDRLPYTIKVLLEAALRHLDGYVVTEQHVLALASYDAKNVEPVEIPFMPGRVVLQDFTGVPAVVDLAAMRAALVRMTGQTEDAKQVNPLVPCDLVIDHSVQVDAFASGMALTINSQKEFDRNNERYRFLKWGQQAFDNFHVVPPATGIVHQVNLEYLAKVVWSSSPNLKSKIDELILCPDSLVGTDSHTTMINGLGVVGWGVGGIEAEAVMLGQPIYMLIPEVVGVKLMGHLPEGATATDLVLRVTELLRGHGVVGKFVEFYGPGLASMPLANRATIANMAPEYGATMGFFPVDEQTTAYLRLTGRDPALVDTVEQYCRTNGLWRDEGCEVNYSSQLELDLASIEPALAGPKRPQDRVCLSDMHEKWQSELASTFGKQAAPEKSIADTGDPIGLRPDSMAVVEMDPGVEGTLVELEGQTFALKHGAVVIAAITSCTNTSNPEVMLAAGLVAQKARQLGLTRKPWVKTSLAPGSKVVTEYYEKAGLTEDLEAMGFHLVGYGCTTCIGNSGPLPGPISDAVHDSDLVVCSVLSGNRNFEGRVNPDVRANYLASPPLVVAYAIAGTVDLDLQHDPLARASDGSNVYLKDIWPSQEEVQRLVQSCVTREQFCQQYANVFEGSDDWRSIESPTGELYEWDSESTYVQEPPFFIGLESQPKPIKPILGARCLAKLGDSVTTDHISPAGAIHKDSPAGRYLANHGVPASMFNSFGSRRGNHEVMMRGTFGNIRVRNQLASGMEGGYTTYYGGDDEPQATESIPPTAGDVEVRVGQVCSIYDAAMAYQGQGVPLVVLAGLDYGMGSSRDWAAKGTYLLGVRAVIAKSFERIHRSNLVGMGVLPLRFAAEQDAESLELEGTEFFNIPITDQVQPRQDITVTAVRANGTRIDFETTCCIDTPVEVAYYRNGGILHTVLRRMAE